jgi:23S rRNA (guanosine2251-2'-O)-methyltransferase
VSHEQRSSPRDRGRRRRSSDEHDLVAGRRAVVEALRAGAATEVLLARGARRTEGLASLLADADAAGVRVREVSRQQLDALADDHRGVVARRVGPPAGAPSGVGALGERDLDTFRFAADAVAVVLDGIEDPQNLGAAARSAEAAGAAMLVTRVRRAAPITAAAVRASAGALEHLPHARVANVGRALGRLQDAGFFVVGLDHAAERTVYEEPCPPGRVALVLGSEGSGLSRLVKDRCDVLVRLPLRGRVDSLNAAAALAAVLYAYVVPTRIGGKMDDDAVRR